MKEERIIVLYETDVLKARKIARKMLSELGFIDAKDSEIEIAISELGGNLIKHSISNGELILKPLLEIGKVGIEIRAQDQGPGIKNIPKAMNGGESTCRSLGIGLSGVKRLMDDFSIESHIGKGTTVIARKWIQKYPSQKMKFSVMAKPKCGETVSGDAYFIKETESFVFFGMIDVLGHGDDAHELALQANELLEINYTKPLLDIIQICHRELRHTRKLAMAVCKVIFKSKKLKHISIGNIKTRILGSTEMSRPFCFNGTVGVAMENISIREYPYTEGCTIIMFTDGISEKFQISREMLDGTPQDIASYIFDNYSMDYDDATVLVGR